MNPSVCLNLCDYDVDRVFGQQLLHASRIYLGSYFCCRFLLQYKEEDWRKVLSACRLAEQKVTLVIPIVTARYEKSIKDLVEHLLTIGKGCIDELVVNDYGTLYWAGKFNKLSLFLGRLFFKDYRDPRYVDYFESTCKPRMFTPYLQRIIEKFQVKGMEFDPICRRLDLSEAFKGLNYAIHSPYCYVTTGQICEFGSVGRRIEEKFRPNAPCQKECSDFLLEYQLDSGQTWFRKGRAVYFQNDTCQVIGISNLRVIQG